MIMINYHSGSETETKPWSWYALALTGRYESQQ